VTGTLVIVLLASFVGLFFNWQIGLLGIVFSCSGLWLANKIEIEKVLTDWFSNDFDLQKSKITRNAKFI